MRDKLGPFDKNIDPDDPKTWPAEMRETMRLAALIALNLLSKEGKRMLEVKVDGLDEPVTMIFALGERAEELRRAWWSVYAVHNPSDRIEKGKGA